MKIAIVHPSYNIKGGAENLMHWLASGLAGRGHRVTMFTADFSRELWDDDWDTRVELVSLQPGLLSRVINSKRVKILEYGNQLSKMLDSFDVIFCSLFPTHLWIAHAKRRNSIHAQIVWYLQEPSRKFYWRITDPHLMELEKQSVGAEYNRHLRRCLSILLDRDNPSKMRRQISWDRKAVKHIDLILANSRFSADNITRAFGVPAHVCYPGIPTDSQPLQKTASGEYLLAVARFSLRKNVQNIIEAMHIVSERHGRKDIPLKIVGQGPCQAELESLVHERNLNSQVEFLGFLDDRELAEAYKRARLTIYLPIDEPFGLIAVESMYRGVPPIVSDHGGLAEIVVHGETGLHVNPFDPVHVAQGVVSLWDDQSTIQKMALAGRRRVEENFTETHLIDRVETLILDTNNDTNKWFEGFR
ncbi:MAG: hypothetical protein Kow0099_13580 [Candidatus Abyssubacteria bacterium]